MSSGPLAKLMGLISVPLRDREYDPDSVEDLEAAVPDIASGVSASGLNNTPMYEPMPNYVPAACEKVISHGTNAWIVLGRDRPSNLASGYGGQAATGAGAIDLVVGRRLIADSPNVDPNFITDAARIHISQTTDVDRNFGLTGGVVGPRQGSSAIGMKADDIRIIGRHGIKIVTEGRGVENSKGGDIKSTVGIDLIAGNDDTGLQPIPRGYELVACIEALVDLMDDLAAMVSSNSTAIQQNCTNIATHIHPVVGPVPGLAVPSPNGALMAGATKTILFLKSNLPMYAHRVNTKVFAFERLKPVGSGWICSRYNGTN